MWTLRCPSWNVAKPWRRGLWSPSLLTPCMLRQWSSYGEAYSRTNTHTHTHTHTHSHHHTHPRTHTHTHTPHTAKGQKKSKSSKSSSCLLHTTDTLKGSISSFTNCLISLSVSVRGSNL